jgi:hypothetical protein
MIPSAAIFIFTKDRPIVLAKTLEAIKNENILITVLDDSYLIRNRRANENKISKFSSAIYHGKKEQEIFFSKLSVKKNDVIKFTNRLGVKGWNLGYSRNYALVLAKTMKLRKVFFMDDDIIVNGKKLIHKLLSLLDTYDFVGSKITGMIDDSVTGYIVRELQYTVEEYYSGGFIAFNPSAVEEFFINLYNEDWIWMYFNELKYSACLFGTVRQIPYDNFKNAAKKAINQEIGEVIIDGIKEAFKGRFITSLKEEKLWDRVLLEKQEYYAILKMLSLQQNQIGYYKILSKVAKYSAQLNSKYFSDIFIKYFRNKKDWNKILNSL